MSLFNLTKEQSFTTFGIDAASITRNAVERVMCFSVIYITHGSALLQIGCNSFHVSDRSIVVFFQNDLVKFTEVTEDFSAQIVLLRNNLSQEAFARLEQYMVAILSKERVYFFEQGSPSIQFADNLFQNLVILSNQLSGDYIYDQVRCHVRSLFTCIFDNIKKKPTNSALKFTRIEEHFSMFIKLLTEHCRKSREVLYYAELMNITPKYLNYICNSVAGIKCKAIIDGYAVSQMKNDLMMTDKSIQEISYDFNFANQSFFGSYFKRFMNMSPRAFRSSSATESQDNC